jgi:hypothetical protein
MKRRLCIPTLCGLLAMAQAVPTQQAPAQGVTAPAGTTFMVRLLTEISTKQRTGARFETVLQEDLRAGDVVIARAGTLVYGTITQSEGGKRVGKQKLAATLSEIKLGGRLVPIVTDTAGASAKYGGGLAKVGSGTLLGAAIGGGTGAVVGGVTGVAATAISKERHITIPAGTIAQVHLRAPLTVP